VNRYTAFRQFDEKKHPSDNPRANPGTPLLADREDKRHHCRIADKGHRKSRSNKKKLTN